MGDLRIGDIVEVQGLRATIRFIGETAFSDGEWVGVELDHPSGKNNGTVQDVQYFVCREKYGMFVRPSIPRLMERPAKPPPGPKVPQPKAQPARKPSIASPSPTPGRISRSGTMKSPTKPPSPTKQVGSRSATPSSSTTATPSRTTTPASGQRPPSLRPTSTRPGSMGPPTKSTPPPVPTTAAKRASVPPSTTPTSTTPTSRTPPALSTPVPRGAPPGTRTSLKPAPSAVPGRKPSPGPPPASERVSPGIGGRRGSNATTASAVSTRSAGGDGGRGNLTAGTPSSSTSTSPSRVRPSNVGNTGSTASAAELATAQRETEDLKSKIAILARKREEDREKLKTLERVQEERDKFEAIIQKIQTKYQPLQHENAELRKSIKEIEHALSEMEQAKIEDDMQLEMAALDREMAEEQAEAYKAELEAVRAKAEEYEMELEILREENEELSQGMDPEQKTSAGWLQLEKQNERLKSALLRLREITSQTEDELREAVKSLEEDNTELQKYKDEYETAQGRLKASESAVEDLRQQLETALGAEEMLEELTERNMNMAEQLDELRATVEDLESLKEIADELEINHIESEKQMQEELDFRDAVISENVKRIVQLEQLNEEAEYNIKRFRDVVRDLQNDLEDMRASQQITETEAEELTARSRAMMDINMKLQITAAKTQNKTIDLELRRMEAEEAMEHLNIVQLFLPDSYMADRDSIQALLRFRRVAFKAQLLQTFVRERMNGELRSNTEDAVLAACEVVDRLTWVSAMCDRFVSCINSCSTAQFTRFQGALLELDPVERALNQWIEGLRRDELKEKQCAADLQRTMALMSHLGEIHLTEDLESIASDFHMRTLLMQSYMESSAAALLHLRALVVEKLPQSESAIEDPEDPATNFFKKADATISHFRSAKVVVSKILRSLDDFRLRNLSLTPDHRAIFETAEEATKKLADYTRSLGFDVFDLLYSVDTLDDPELSTPSWTALQNTMTKTTERVLGFSETDFFSALSKEMKSVTHTLVDLASQASDIDSTVEFERSPAPWVLRAQELKQTKTVDLDTESEIIRLRDDIIERATQLKIRDQTIDEMSVKIELLEARMRSATKQASRVGELEESLANGKLREQELSDIIENLTEDVVALETEMAKMKAASALAPRLAANASIIGEDGKRIPGSGGPGSVAATNAPIEVPASTLTELARLKRDVTALSASVAFFRAESAALSHHDLVKPDSWLNVLLLPTPATSSASRTRSMKNRLAREADDVFSELRSAVLESRVIPVDETRTLRWKPVKETMRWRVQRQKERWESVVSWKEDVVKRVNKEVEREAGTGPAGEGKKGVGKKLGASLRPPVAAKVVLARKWRTRGWLGDEVRVGEPGDWEEVMNALGVEEEETELGV